MKYFIVFASVMMIGFSFSQAQTAVKSCEELKAEIAAKLTAKGVTNYELTVSADAGKTNGKIVGSCEDGSKKIFYSKSVINNSAALAKPAQERRLVAETANPAAGQGGQEIVPVVAVKMIQVESKPSGKSCEELKTEIAAKLAAKGVTSYDLTISADAGKANGKVVGSCENGSKQIIYVKK
jgi:hypothetical protein